jgi:hypothetical protein
MVDFNEVTHFAVDIDMIEKEKVEVITELSNFVHTKKKK